MNEVRPAPTLCAGGIVQSKTGDLIMVLQRNRTWSFPKGKINPDEDPITAACREIHEETGITRLITLGHLGTYQRRSGKLVSKTICLFWFRTSEMDLRPQDPAITMAKWVPVDTATAMISNRFDREFFQTIMHRL